MAKAKKLYTFVEVSDEVPVQKLPLMDQIRVLFRSLTYDPANDLKNEDAVTHEYLSLKANLSDFLRKATEPIREGKSRTVYVQIASEFKTVLNEVLRSPEIANFYRVSMVKPKIDYDIPFDIMLKLSVKTR